MKIKKFYFKSINSTNDKAIKIKPNFIDAYNGRGNVYKNLKLYNKALLDYEKVLQLNPNFFNIWLRNFIAPASLGVTLGNLIKSLDNCNSLIIVISL